MPENKNVKFQPGKYYSPQNWDSWINIIDLIPEKKQAVLYGYKLSKEPIRTDETGNEFIQLENLKYYAYCKL